MVNRGRCVGLIATWLVLSAAAPALGEPLKTTKPWVLEYAETQCVAYRQYGSEHDPTTFAIRPAPNGETYELLVGRRRNGPEFALQFEGSVDFGQGRIKAWVLYYGSEKSKYALHQFRIRANQMAQARTANSVTLNVKTGPETSFVLQSMPDLLKGLEQCTQDLRQYWNMDAPANVGSAAKPPKGDVRSIFFSNDYPQEALDRLQGGTVQFLLLVDEQGKVAGCHVLTPSGVPVLDARGCQVIRERARFKPATDANGKPVRSTYVTPKVRWEMGF